MSPSGFEQIAGIRAPERCLTTEPRELLLGWKKQPPQLVTACHRYVTACHRGAFGWKKQPAELPCHRYVTAGIRAPERCKSQETHPRSSGLKIAT